jgi:hypothetical protein
MQKKKGKNTFILIIVIIVGIALLSSNNKSSYNKYPSINQTKDVNSEINPNIKVITQSMILPDIFNSNQNKNSGNFFDNFIFSIKKVLQLQSVAACSDYASCKSQEQTNTQENCKTMNYCLNGQPYIFCGSDFFNTQSVYVNTCNFAKKTETVYLKTDQPESSSIAYSKPYWTVAGFFSSPDNPTYPFVVVKSSYPLWYNLQTGYTITSRPFDWDETNFKDYRFSMERITISCETHMYLDPNGVHSPEGGWAVGYKFVDSGWPSSNIPHSCYRESCEGNGWTVIEKGGYDSPGTDYNIDLTQSQVLANVKSDGFAYISVFCANREPSSTIDTCTCTGSGTSKVCTCQVQRVDRFTYVTYSIDPRDFYTDCPIGYYTDKYNDWTCSPKQCNSDADCSLGNCNTNDYTCRKCYSNSMCDSGKVCSLFDNKCMAVECIFDSDCQLGAKCTSNKCVGTFDKTTSLDTNLATSQFVKVGGSFNKLINISLIGIVPNQTAYVGLELIGNASGESNFSKYYVFEFVKLP